MSTDSLINSIELYQNQLAQVEQALSIAGEEERKPLLCLQADLLQLLDLTLQQLTKEQEEKHKSSLHKIELINTIENSNIVFNTNSSELFTGDKSEEQKRIDDEFALFKAELAELESSSDSNPGVEKETETNCLLTENELEIKSKSLFTFEALKALEGNYFRAPFTESWGGHSYHNAVVLDIVTNEHDNLLNLNNPKVRVLYSQPTCLKMLTCRFFLDGHCDFYPDSCRYSHGTEVYASDLVEFKEPDFDSIVSGSRVLARHSGDLWKIAIVQDILEDRSSFCIKYEHSKSVREVDLKNILPLESTDETEEKNEQEGETLACGDFEEPILDGSDGDESDVDQAVFIPTSKWFQNITSQRLGDWEKHTKGIGSKLMQKMGYIIGTGLGKNGEGKVEPVEAYVYPKGVSLDKCMELKEAAGGEDLYKVEKRLERAKKKEEARSQVAYERAQPTSVFDIINNKLRVPGPCHTADDKTNEDIMTKKVNVSRSILQKNSSKELNIKNFQVSTKIRQLEKEILKIQETACRQSNSKLLSKVIDDKLQTRIKELESLKDAEVKVNNEQKVRRDAKKFSVF